MANIIYGFHAVLARLKQNAESMIEIYVDEKNHNPRLKPIMEYAAFSNVAIKTLDFQRANFLNHARHQGVAAKVSRMQKHMHLADILETLDSPKMLLVLDGITDSRNLGALLRSADGAGVQAVIAPKDRSVGLNEAAVKTASGAAESVPYVMVTNLARTLRQLQDQAISVVGLAEEAEQTLYEASWPSDCAFVLGAEGTGLRQLTKKTCDFLVRIPMLGMVESLNVSVAGSIVLYEARRRLLKQAQ